jgi:hypothetical protein
MPKFSTVGIAHLLDRSASARSERWKEEKREPTSHFGRRRFSELVEDVEVSLVLDLADDSTFFEEVVGDLSPDGSSLGVKHDLEVFAL